MVVVILAELAFVALAWPDDWEPAAQAALAGVLITVAGSLLSVAVKWTFDSISLKTEHRLRLQGKIMETFYTYSGHYLMPLAGVVEELAKYLRAYQAARSDDKKIEALDGAFYSAAWYVRLHAALIGTLPLENVERPLGLFLKSRDREQLVWDLMMPPWALGIRSLEQESLLIQSLTRGSPSSSDAIHQLTPPHDFIRNSHDPDHALSLLQQRFEKVVGGHDHLAEMIDVLTALNELINYEVRLAFDAWYTDVDGALPESIGIIKAFPDELKAKLGIFYRAKVTEKGS